MPRRPIPDDQKLETVGINLNKQITDRLEEIAAEWGDGVKPTHVGREMLLLGLTLYEALAAKGVDIGELELLSAFRRAKPPSDGKIKVRAKREG